MKWGRLIGRGFATAEQTTAASLYRRTTTPTVFTSSQLDPQLDLAAYRGESRRLFNLATQYVSPADLGYQLPDRQVAEFAFVGRSNVGKSSLVSALIGHNEKLVRISRTPGATRTVNYFAFASEAAVASGGAARQPAFYLVDMPGYGFARAARDEQAKWVAVMRGFLQQRDLTTLRRVFVLVDSRHGLKPSDVDMMALLNAAGLPYQVILTKTDASSGHEMHRALDSIMAHLMRRGGGLNCGLPLVHTVSAKTGAGLEDLKDAVAEMMSHSWQSRTEVEVPPEQRALAAQLLARHVETDTLA